MQKLIDFSDKKNTNFNQTVSASPIKKQPLRKIIAKDIFDSPDRMNSAALENSSR